MKKKFKKGDVVIVKENTTGGFADGKIGVIVKEGTISSDYNSFEVEAYGGGRSYRHDQNDLRKIKKYNKEHLRNEDVKVKKGDIVIVKHNLSGGHKEGTVCRVKRDESLESLLIEDIGTGRTKWHCSRELRKIKGW